MMVEQNESDRTWFSRLLAIAGRLALPCLQLIRGRLRPRTPCPTVPGSPNKDYSKINECGDYDPYHGCNIEYLVGLDQDLQEATYVVYLDDKLDVAWCSTNANRKASSGMRCVIGRMAMLEAMPIQHLERERQKEFRTLLGEGLKHYLSCREDPEELKDAEASALALFARAERLINQWNGGSTLSPDDFGKNKKTNAAHSETKTVLELDLASYSDIARVLEENLDVHAVKAFEDQVQSFVDYGLNEVKLKRDDVVLGTAGDNAILIFDQAATMHCFAKAVHQAVVRHNADKTIDSAKRWFRMGAATGTVLVLQSERRIVGATVARAVRLEAAAQHGQLLVDVATYNVLPDDLKPAYGEEEGVSGKRDERFIARRCTFETVKGPA